MKLLFSYFTLTISVLGLAKTALTVEDKEPFRGISLLLVFSVLLIVSLWVLVSYYISNGYSSILGHIRFKDYV